MKFTTKEIVLTGIFASITAVLSQIYIPLKPVPITFQIFAVVLSATILGGKLGGLSQLVYVLLGAVGLPVFSEFSGGFHYLTGPTGGYIISFPIIAFLIGYFVDRKQEPTKIYIIFASILGLVVCYAIGTLQLSLVLKLSFIKALQFGVIPFVPLDILKMIIVSIVGCEIRKALIKANLLYVKKGAVTI